MKNKFTFADLKYVDLMGKLHHLTVPYDQFNIKKSYGIDGSSIPGFASRTRSDLVIIPDPKTEFTDPFFEKPTVSYFAKVCFPDGGRLPIDPRNILKKATKIIKKYGRAYFLPEFEFYLFSRLEIDHWQGGMSISYEVDDRGKYHSPLPLDSHLDIRNKITDTLRSVGIKVRYHHHEGGAGQQEIELTMRPVDKIADEIILTRYIIKNVAKRNGYTVSFLPRPLVDKPGSGFHLHHKIEKKGKSIFGTKRLTKTGKYYLSGILNHALALTPFSNPSTNSYRRFDSSFEAPTETNFSPGNRNALVRIPEYSKEIRFEYRPSDSTANPYLLIGSIICAGVDGIENQIELERLDIMPLPRDIYQAIEFLYTDNQFLIDRIFDRATLDKYIDVVAKQADKVSKSPHPLEFEIYQ